MDKNKTVYWNYQIPKTTSGIQMLMTQNVNTIATVRTSHWASDERHAIWNDRYEYFDNNLFTITNEHHKSLLLDFVTGIHFLSVVSTQNASNVWTVCVGLCLHELMNSSIDYGIITLVVAFNAGQGAINPLAQPRVKHQQPKFYALWLRIVANIDKFGIPWWNKISKVQFE